MADRHNPADEEYRIFVGAFPGGELAERIQAVRLHYDPLTARSTPPHVTLAGTYWRHGEPVPFSEVETIRPLLALGDTWPAFQLNLGGIFEFAGVNPVVFLGVQLDKGLLNLRNALLDILGPDKHDSFHPHLTLAMRLAEPEADRMAAELKTSEWSTSIFPTPISELRFMQRGHYDQAWRCIATIPLKGEIAGTA